MTLGPGQEACKQGSHLGEMQGGRPLVLGSRCFLRPALHRALGAASSSCPQALGGAVDWRLDRTAVYQSS